jgi:hypothetical protein
MHKMITATAAAVALFAASAASAATLDFQFDAANSGISISNNTIPFCFYGSCALSASLMTPFSNLTLSQGQSQTFDFALFNIAPGFGGGSADVNATLAFTLPDAGPASTGGHGVYGTFGGVISGGGLFWNDPTQQFTTSDGSEFTVKFNDLKGVTFGNSAVDTVTITADSIAAGVPEPGVWAMLIIGLGMIGTALRRKPSKAPLAA